MDHITAHHRNALYFAETNTAPRPHLVRPTRQPNHMLATEVLAWSRSSGNPTRPVSMGWTMAQPPKNKVPQSCCSLGGHSEKNLGTRANAPESARAFVSGVRRARLAGRMTVAEAVLISAELFWVIMIFCLTLNSSCSHYEILYFL